MRVLGISGSLQASSSNTRLLEAARDDSPADVDFMIFPSVGALPHFTPDDDGTADMAVQTLRRELAAAHAVLIATPEYAHALPGSLKNALDWIVGSGELYGKPVSIVSASPSPERGANAREMLERTLRAQGAIVVGSTTIQVGTGERVDLAGKTRRAVRQVLDELMARGV